MTNESNTRAVGGLYPTQTTLTSHSRERRTMSLYDCVNDIREHGDYPSDETCVDALRRQDFFTPGTDSDVYLFIGCRRTLFDGDSKIVAEKFAYFPVLVPVSAVKTENGIRNRFDVIWAWPTDLEFALDGKPFLPEVGDEISCYCWSDYQAENCLGSRMIKSVSTFTVERSNPKYRFVKITSAPFAIPPEGE